MKKFLFLASLFFPFYANATCMEHYFDKNGDLHMIKCGSNRPELQCDDKTYWNGKSCAPIKIIKYCESLGGKWKQVQLRVPLPNSKKPSFAIICACPNKKVWDGKKCRKDIPLSQQCTNYGGNGTIRMTKSFFGSEDCPKVSK